MQCMAAAMTAGATASGARAYVATRRFSWMTPKRLKTLTISLIALAVIASSLVLGGGSAPNVGGY